MDYKEKLRLAKEALESGSYDKDTIEYIFPELRESKDEKIRQKFIKLVKMSNEVGGFALHKWEADEMLAWLEKQGEQKPKDRYTFKSIPRLLEMIKPTDKAKAYCQKLINILAKEGYNTDAKIVEEVLNGWNGEDVPMAVMDEKQGEQKPSTEVKPKFHEGDWIVDNIGVAHQIEKTVLNVTNNTFGYDIVGGGYFNDDSDVHLWTIQDARDGDVLAFKNNIGGIIICKSPTDYDTRSYCRLVSDNLINKEESGWDSTLFVPATKEQRDLLFQKMKESGYEWDDEKKELKKIEKKSQRMVSAEAKEALYDKPTDEEMKELLRTEYEKGRADTIAEMEKDWSEEDEKQLMKAIWYVDNPAPLVLKDTMLIEWLKQLKQRIGE